MLRKQFMRAVKVPQPRGAEISAWRITLIPGTLPGKYAASGVQQPINCKVRASVNSEPKATASPQLFLASCECLYCIGLLCLSTCVKRICMDTIQLSSEHFLINAMPLYAENLSPSLSPWRPMPWEKLSRPCSNVSCLELEMPTSGIGWQLLISRDGNPQPPFRDLSEGGDAPE